MEKRSRVIRAIIVLMVFAIVGLFGGNSHAASHHSSQIVCIQYTFLNSPQIPSMIGSTTTTETLITPLGKGFFTMNSVQLDPQSGELPYIGGGVGHMVGNQLVINGTNTSLAPIPNVYTGQVILDYTNPSNVTGTFFVMGSVYDQTNNTFLNYYMDGTADQVPCQ